MMDEQQRQFALSLLAYGVQRGVSAERLCQLAGIDLDALKKKNNTTISAKQVADLWKNASLLCDDPLFGLHFGESLQLAALGAVGEIIKSSETVGEAVRIAASFTPAVTSLFIMDVKKHQKSFSIQLIPTSFNQDDFTARQFADLLMVFTVHEMNGFVLEKIHPETVQYPYKLSNIKEYERVLRCKPVTKKSNYTLEFSNRYWGEPILTANYEVQQLLLQKVNQSSTEGTPASIELQVKVMDYLMKNSYLGILSLEDVAGNFNMSPRSLQRRLQEESVTFQQLADSVRKSLAIHYLESGKHQIKEISAILGYNELSAFSRAFKRWTGKAPLEYQG